jgi:hypothetical protein
MRVALGVSKAMGTPGASAWGRIGHRRCSTRLPIFSYGACDLPDGITTIACAVTQRHGKLLNAAIWQRHRGQNRGRARARSAMPVSASSCGWCWGASWFGLHRSTHPSVSLYVPPSQHSQRRALQRHSAWLRLSWAGMEVARPRPPA